MGDTVKATQQEKKNAPKSLANLLRSTKLMPQLVAANVYNFFRKIKDLIKTPRPEDYETKLNNLIDKSLTPRTRTTNVTVAALLYVVLVYAKEKNETNSELPAEKTQAITRLKKIFGGQKIKDNITKVTEIIDKKDNDKFKTAVVKANELLGGKMTIKEYTNEAANQISGLPSHEELAKKPLPTPSSEQPKPSQEPSSPPNKPLPTPSSKQPEAQPNPTSPARPLPPTPQKKKRRILFPRRKAPEPPVTSQHSSSPPSYPPPPKPVNPTRPAPPIPAGKSSSEKAVVHPKPTHQAPTPSSKTSENGGKSIQAVVDKQRGSKKRAQNTEQTDNDSKNDAWDD